MSDINKNELSTLNKLLEDKLKKKRVEVKNKVINVIKNLSNIELDQAEHVKIHMDMLILREDLVFEVANYNSKLNSIKSVYRKQKKEKYYHYSNNFEIKLNSYYDKDVFISADLTELQRQIDIMNSFTDFLKEQISTCDKLGFSIKHIVERNNL